MSKVIYLRLWCINLLSCLNLRMSSGLMESCFFLCVVWWVVLGIFIILMCFVRLWWGFCWIWFIVWWCFGVILGSNLVCLWSVVWLEMMWCVFGLFIFLSYWVSWLVIFGLRICFIVFFGVSSILKLLRWFGVIGVTAWWRSLCASLIMWWWTVSSLWICWRTLGSICNVSRCSLEVWTVSVSCAI